MENLKNHHLVDFVFFSDNEILKKGTSEYNDFWMFWDKYERFRKSKKQPEPSSLKDGNKFDFPTKFDKRYKINLAISTTTIKERYKEYTNRYSDRRACGITMDQLFDLKQILLYYYDFLQKQKFSKLLKLKEDQKNLPIYQYKEQIIYTLRSNQVVVIAGDTGCGKSTQVPQYLLDGGFTNIACTQPRKIACVSLAKRVGYETLNEYKSEIGYQVRFETNKTKLTKVLFLTEGVLLRQFQSDPELSMYNVIVVDEVHERHINGDFLLGVLKCLLQQRSDLRLILMSATINIELFVNYFSNSPVVQVPGRLFPIELQYVPHFLDKSEKSGVNERLNPSPYLRIMQLIDKKYPSNERGDLLIFMSGMAEISAVVEAAKEYAFKTIGWIILPLHSALSIEEQDKVFDISPEGVRKCIVSTNIAETSVTIDGVRFVADSGKVKEMRYDTQVKMQRLQEFWISQASAEQRKGRAGRTGPGVCFRLFSDADYESFSPYSTSEIHRVPLESLVLQMTSLGLRDATLFPFIEPPAKNSLINSTYLLKQQGAITSDGELTPIGRMLARLPVDITLGKMLIMGSLFSLVEPVLVISAALSVQSPLTKCFGQSGNHESESRRKELLSKHGDAFSLLNIYDEWILVKSDRKSNSRKWCKRRGIEEQRLYEISKLKRQFENLLKDYGLLNRNKLNLSSDHSRSKNQPSRKELLSLKRQHNTSNSRKRKLLKLHRIGEEDVDDGDSENEDEGTHIDIHDIDFKLNHNLATLEASSKRNRRFTHRDINILKLIISSGLYPQIALADESNPYRKQNEQVFHNKDKQFLLLHPTSVFSLQPDFLESFYNQDETSSKQKAPEGRYSDCKEFLIYVSLLETNKPYIMNSMKVPALQTLLLLSRSITTNSDCSKVVVDDWIELTFEKEFEVRNLLGNVVRLRTAWDTLLEEKLVLCDDEDKNVVYQRLKKIRRLEEIVSVKLAEFLAAKIEYKLRRLSSLDIKCMYISDSEKRNIGINDQSSAECSSTPSSSCPRGEKGGNAVTSYLTFGCIRDDFTLAVAANKAEYLVEHYHCQTCGEHVIGTLFEQLKHNESCGIVEGGAGGMKTDEKEDEEETPNKEQQPSSSKSSYFCELCKTPLDLTPVEILKHKLSHR